MNYQHPEDEVLPIDLRQRHSHLIDLPWLSVSIHQALLENA